MKLDPQALELNETINSVNPHLVDMFSSRGKAIYFPKQGILSQSADAAGKEINATIGTALEDNGSPMVLRALTSQFVKIPLSSFNYAPSPGRPDFRKMWAQHILKKNPLLEGSAISLPIVTCALTHGLSMTGYLFLDPDDPVILPDLYWENYDLIFRLAYGARIATYPTFSENGFNIEGLRDTMAGQPGKKKTVLLNFPNNPTGYTVTDSEAYLIRDILLEAAENGNDIVAVLDDAYSGFVYEEGTFKESLFGLLASAHERILAVKLDGPTKEDYAWGFRVGFMTFGCAKNSPEAYSALESKLAGAIRGNISNASNIGQTLLQTAYADGNYDQEKAEKYARLKSRYETIKGILSSHPEYAEIFCAMPFNSGYFMCVRFKTDAEPVRQLLLKKYGIGTIVFGYIMRVAFSSTPMDKLEKLFDSIYKAGKESLKA